MSRSRRARHLMIEHQVESVAVRGAVFELSEAEQAVDLVRGADDGVLMILHVKDAERHAKQSGGAPSSSAALDLMAWTVADLIARRTRTNQLIEAMTPRINLPSEAMVLQARRNSEARKELLEEFGALTGPQVAELVGSTAANKSALAARWRAEGRVFAVSYLDSLYYPSFQLGEALRPLPIVADLLAMLRTRMLSDWEIALWFTTRNGWLSDRRPVDLLTTEPDLVRAAAAHEVAEIAG